MIDRIKRSFSSRACGPITPRGAAAFSEPLGTITIGTHSIGASTLGGNKGQYRFLLWALLAGLVCWLAVANPAWGSGAKRCVLDDELPSYNLPDCAIETVNGKLRVKPQFVTDKNFDFNRFGLAPAGIRQSPGWSYIDRRGWVIVTHVSTMENGADVFYHGLVRVERNGKFGLADPKGRMVVPFSYDGMLDWSSDTKEGWGACTGCSLAKDFEYHYFKGGQWVRLNAKGQVIERNLEK